jgi:glutamate-1-semialdehyde aminotransferase
MKQERLLSLQFERSRSSHAKAGKSAGYLEAVRETTPRVGAALIFHEVITGYRLALRGGARAVRCEP